MDQLLTRRRVEFADTDMARIVHFSRFFVFMEAAEHEFLRAALTDDTTGEERQIHFEHEGREIGWPRVRATCQYQSPARLGDMLEIQVTVERLGTKSITWGFAFHVGERKIADGEITTICCRVDGPELEAIAVPTFLAERLRQHDPAATPSGDATEPEP